jgi:hypothetical protein
MLEEKSPAAFEGVGSGSSQLDMAKRQRRDEIESKLIVSRCEGIAPDNGEMSVTAML